MGLPFEQYFASQSSKPIVGIDLGAHSICLAQAEVSPGQKPKITSLGHVKTPEDTVSGGTLKKTDKLADAILRLFDANQIETKRVAFAIPSSAVFTKTITMSKSAVSTIDTNIHFEASNYIPHRIDAVNLDYQILQENPSGGSDVLLVAVKQDILDSYASVFRSAGLEPLIADVDSFCLVNLCEQSNLYSEKKMIAAVDVGYKDSTVSLIHNGRFVLSGEVNSGGKNYIEALTEGFKISDEQAELILKGKKVDGVEEVLVEEAIDRTTALVAGELQRQMKFFWSGAGVEDEIEKVVLTGGAAAIPRLREELQTKTSLDCEFLDHGSYLEFSSDIDPTYYSECGPSLSVALGLALRRVSDKAWTSND